MDLEIRKISDFGTSHVVVARLGVQSSDFINWLEIEKPARDAVTHLYVYTLTQRLLRCHDYHNGLIQRINSAFENMAPRNSPRVREVPHVIGLDGLAEGFLYEAKNYLRDLLALFQIVYGCGLKDASAFTNLKTNGDSDVVKWAAMPLGPDEPLNCAPQNRAGVGW
jgi:hypothetical protein